MLVKKWNDWQNDPLKKYNYLPPSLHTNSLEKELPNNQLYKLIDVVFLGNKVRYDFVEILDDKIIYFVNNYYEWHNSEDCFINSHSLTKQSISALKNICFKELTENMLNNFIKTCPQQLLTDIIQLMNYMMVHCPNYYSKNI